MLICQKEEDNARFGQKGSFFKIQIRVVCKAVSSAAVYAEGLNLVLPNAQVPNHCICGIPLTGSETPVALGSLGAPTALRRQIMLAKWTLSNL